MNKEIARKYRNINFLNGQDSIPASSEGHAEFLYDAYGDWGYREHHVGTLIQWMFNKLNDIQAVKKIKEIKTFINNFNSGLYPNSVNQVKKTLLSWFVI